MVIGAMFSTLQFILQHHTIKWQRKTFGHCEWNSSNFLVNDIIKNSMDNPTAIELLWYIFVGDNVYLPWNSIQEQQKKQVNRAAQATSGTTTVAIIVSHIKATPEPNNTITTHKLVGMSTSLTTKVKMKKRPTTMHRKSKKAGQPNMSRNTSNYSTLSVLWCTRKKQLFSTWRLPGFRVSTC